MNANWHIASHAGVPGAVAVIHLHGDIDEALNAAAIAPVAVGQVVVRDLCGVDRGVVARWTEGSAFLMPHGGVAIVRSLVRELVRRGVPEGRPPDPRVLYPEAADEIEARMLVALARAASPLAVDLLLDQPRRWRTTPSDEGIDERSAVLNRLIDPPLVVAVGPPNVGKSTLVNALAGRAVSIVAEEAGTTRDHVGVLLDLSGLVVRWVDTPGLRDVQGPESQAIALALALLPAAALVVECFDSRACLPAPVRHPNVMCVQLRTDLGIATQPAAVRVSVREGRGMRELVEAVRERLVPEAARRHPGRWRFW